jgi:long-chain acyl-CoA synthetase
VIATGEAHSLDFGARLDLAEGDVDAADLFGGDPADRHLDADLAHLACTGPRPGSARVWSSRTAT